MAEESFFWDGKEVGDAVLAPYSGTTFREVFRRLILHDETQSGVIKAGLGVAGLGYSGNQYTFGVGPGAAIVKGVMYVNDTAVRFPLTIPASGTYYYAIVLRYFANAVRIAVLGPSTSGFPSLTQTNTQFELLIANVTMPANAVYKIGTRVNRLNLNDRGKIIVKKRIGGHADDFATPGTTVYTISADLGMQIGVVNWTGAPSTTGNVTVTFPKPFTKVPLGFANTVNPNISSHPLIHVVPTIDNITTTQMTIYWLSTGGNNLSSIDFNWIALGTMLYD